MWKELDALRQNLKEQELSLKDQTMRRESTKLELMEKRKQLIELMLSLKPDLKKSVYDLENLQHRAQNEKEELNLLIKACRRCSDSLASVMQERKKLRKWGFLHSLFGRDIHMQLNKQLHITHDLAKKSLRNIVSFEPEFFRELFADVAKTLHIIETECNKPFSLKSIDGPLLQAYDEIRHYLLAAEDEYQSVERQMEELEKKIDVWIDQMKS